MLTQQQPQHDINSILSILAWKQDKEKGHYSLSYATKKQVFPLLHLGVFTGDQGIDFSIKNYKRTKDEKAVEFVANYLDNCWINGKTDQDDIGFYEILDEFNANMGIKGRKEEFNIGSRLDLCHIIRYFELSEVYNKSFFFEIWKNGPAEVKAELKMRLNPRKFN